MIDSTAFGMIEVDGKIYEHDVVVSYKGKVKQAKTEVRHLLGRKEFFDLLFERPEVIVVGTGQAGALEISEEVRNFASEQKVELIALPTPEAIKEFNNLIKKGKKVVGYFHVTC